jgi:hypothetical protein
LKNTFNKLFFSALTLMTLTLAGCATVFSGSTQTINVKVVDSTTGSDLEGFTCSVRDLSGNETQIIDGVVIVKKGNGALHVSCKKDGYRLKNIGIGSGFNGVSLVNILAPIGFLVDALTGSMWEFPSHIVVSMEKM